MKQTAYKTIGDELKMSSFIDIYQKAYLNLLFTANYLSIPVNKALKTFGLTNSQFNVLRILRGQKGKPIAATQIQERMIYPNSNVTRILEKLTEKGLIECSTCPENRRKNNILITAAGLKLLEETDRVSLAAYNQLHETVSAEDAAALNMILDKLRNNTSK